jgi:hypothetical protein
MNAVRTGGRAVDRVDADAAIVVGLVEECRYTPGLGVRCRGGRTSEAAPSERLASSRVPWPCLSYW